MESLPPRSKPQINYCVRTARRDLKLKMEAGGPLEYMDRELRRKQGGKCFICSVSLNPRDRTRVRRKVATWELAASKLAVKEVLRLANDKDNLIAIHKRCWWSIREMQKRSAEREATFALLNASIGNTDTSTPEATALLPIQNVARDRRQLAVEPRGATVI